MRSGGDRRARRGGSTVSDLPFVNGSYRTDANRRSALGRISPGLVFYSRIFLIIYRASAKAKRGRYDDGAWQHSSLTTARALEAAGVRFDITGLDHVAATEGPCVFIGNHMSTLETFLLPAILLPFKRITFVVKQSLMDYPVFGHVMRSRDPIAVGRTNPREDLKAVLEGGAERLRKGVSVVIFPQTTRLPRFDPKDFNTIGVKLAKRAEAPVLPLALKTDAWGNGRLVKDFGKIDPSKTVYFAFGTPLRIRDRGNEEHDAITRFVMDKLKVWGGTVKA
jgi:1-acyl-sn-glycerol-3-phosphate acyltransferase